MLNLIISTSAVCVCKYVDAEIFLFEKTSANSLEMYYFLHINTKLFVVLSMVIITNFRRHSLTSVSLSTGLG